MKFFGKKKKKSLFQRILLPVAGAIILQSILSACILIFGDSLMMLRENSLYILKQNVEGRAASLENEILQRWANLEQCVTNINGVTEAFVKKRQISTETLRKDMNLAQELFLETSESLLYTLRKNSVTGVFMILSNGQESQWPEKEMEFQGVYFRDLDPSNATENYSDILLERGSTRISRNLSIPLNTSWHSQFEYYPDMVLNSHNEVFQGTHYDTTQARHAAYHSMAFYFAPFMAAQEMPSIGWKNLGYFSNSFCLSESAEQVYDGKRIITYSVPLFDSEGSVYAVVGVEVSVDILLEMLPAKEIDSYNRGGYMLVVSDRFQEQGSFVESVSAKEPVKAVVQAVSGAVLEQVLPVGSTVSFQMEPQYENFWMVNDVSLLGQPLYGKADVLNLYNSNTPFSDFSWAVVGVANNDALFGVTQQLTMSIWLSCLLSIGIGVVVVWLVARFTTRPLTEIMERLRESKPNQLLQLKPVNIHEIDLLSQTISDLTARQRQIEMDLESERERYLLALESTTDIILEYDVRRDLLMLYYIDPENVADERSIENRVTQQSCNGYGRLVRDGLVCPMEDIPLMLDFLAGKLPEITVLCRFTTVGDADPYWYTIKGLPVYDADDTLQRVIGSSRNVHEKKLRELELQEADQRDAVTGMFKGNVGERKIRKQLGRLIAENLDGKFVPGCLCIFSIANLNTLIDELGIIHCNLFLEELGRLLRLHLCSQDIALRLNISDILIWLPDAGRLDASSLVKHVLQTLKDPRLKENSEMIRPRYEADFMAVADVPEEFSNNCSKMLEWMVRQCKERAKLIEPGKAPAFQRESGADIIGTDGSVNIWSPIPQAYLEFPSDLVALTFALFEHTRNIENALPALLRRLGWSFRLRRVYMLLDDRDFYTNRVDAQWQHNSLPPLSQEIFRFSLDDYRLMEERYALQNFFVLSSETGPSALPQSFLHMLRYPGNGSSLVCSMYDNGVYYGCIVFEDCQQDRSWLETDQNILSEIVRIIGTHLAKSRADLASRAKSEFLSRMSHEIRTPINGIMGMTNIALTDEKLPPKTTEYLEKILTSTRYLTALINDILDMSRIESGKMKLEQGVFDVTTLSKDLDILIRPQAELKQLRFTMNVDVKTPCIVGDKLRLNQILLNLLGNAVKFTDAGGAVSLSIQELSASVESGLQPDAGMEYATIRFCVTDTGVGIAPENLSRIFDSFEQAENSTARKFGGTGLGLSISRRLVEMMGGRLEVSSELDKGSSFWFILRLAANSSADSPIGITQGSEQDAVQLPDIAEEFARKHVLLVEDNDLNLEIAQTILEMAGCYVSTARNGQEAVDLFAASPPHESNGRSEERDSSRTLNTLPFDAILMDIRMPVMDGLTATRSIRRLSRPDAKTIPIIAMTANAFDEDTRQSIDSGMNGYLVKPFELEQLFRILHQALSTSSQEADSSPEAVDAKPDSTSPSSFS